MYVIGRYLYSPFSCNILFPQGNVYTVISGTVILYFITLAVHIVEVLHAAVTWRVLCENTSRHPGTRYLLSFTTALQSHVEHRYVFVVDNSFHCSYDSTKLIVPSEYEEYVTAGEGYAESVFSASTF
jgi:hypothetical protein